MLRKFLIMTVVTIYTQLPAPNLKACSTFKLQKGDELIYAHNLDEPGKRVPGIIYVNKRGVFKTGRSFTEIFVGKDLGGFYSESVIPSQFCWISRYGSVTVSPWGRDFPDGGINEAGLYIWEMGLAATGYPKNDKLPKLMQSNWVQYVLDNCGTIDEALAAAAEFELMGMNWHYFLGDGNGNCAVLEFIDGKIVVHDGEKMPVPALFNQTYERDLKSMQFYKGFGGVYETNLEDPRVPRIAKAATMLRNFNPARSNPMDYAKLLLHHVGNKPYKWGILVDIKRGVIHFNTESYQKWKRFSYRGFEYSNSGPVMVLDIDQQKGGDVLGRFHPQQDKEIKESIMQFGLSDEFYEYFHTSREAFAERSATAYHEAEKSQRQYFRGLWKGDAVEADETGERERLQLELRTAGSAVRGTVRFRDEIHAIQHLKLVDKKLEFTFRTQKGTVIIARGTIDGEQLRLNVVWTEGVLGDFLLNREQRQDSR